jgi:integrating conjugative element protein (TIGR03765 family)
MERSMVNHRHRVAVAVLCFFTAQSHAGPEVIKDYGGTPSGVPTPAQLQAAYDQSPEADLPAEPLNPYPIRSIIGPGQIEKRMLAAPAPRPFFILGTDEASRRWLSVNKQYLLTLQTTGYVTALDSESQLLDMNRLASPLKLYPLPITQEVVDLGITAYPVLIHGREIKQ